MRGEGRDDQRQADSGKVHYANQHLLSRTSFSALCSSLTSPPSSFFFHCYAGSILPHPHYLKPRSNKKTKKKCATTVPPVLIGLDVVKMDATTEGVGEEVVLGVAVLDVGS